MMTLARKERKSRKRQVTRSKSKTPHVRVQLAEYLSHPGECYNTLDKRLFIRGRRVGNFEKEEEKK